MTRATGVWNPQAKSRLVLARAWGYVQSVPYAVSLRWLFYRLYQDGTYSSKDDYKNKFVPLLSDARHNFYEGWRPYTLTDETRDLVDGGHGFDTPDDWFSAVAEMSCGLDHWRSQDFYGLLVFEARAMAAQFEYYAPEFTRVPLGGDPSIPYKWRVAQRIRERHEKHGQTTRLWYFGDLDSKGLTIYQTTMRDIQEWAGVRFGVERVGLTSDQAERFGLPESVEHPGAFQWESLGDEQARSLIEIATAEIDGVSWSAVNDEETQAEETLGDALRREGLAS